jgi:hypothetical protein
LGAAPRRRSAMVHALPGQKKANIFKGEIT